MNLEEVQKNLEENKALLIDVRELTEWNEGHIPCAVFCPLSDLIKGIIPTFDQDKILYLHCRSGGRVVKAIELLKPHYPNLIPLKFDYFELHRTFTKTSAIPLASLDSNRE